VEDTQSSDEQILAPMGWKNVRQLTYRTISQKVDAGSQARKLERVLTRGSPVMRCTGG
jgi:hypothetical protein